MTFPKARLAVSACLLLGWISFLGFLVYETRGVVVLSKPQFMIAQLYVVVNVRDNDGKADPDVTVEEVLWASVPGDEKLAEQRLLHLPDISRCAKEHGYRGAGKYLVPLVHSPVGYMIARYETSLTKEGIRIYLYTPETDAQVKAFTASRAP